MLGPQKGSAVKLQGHLIEHLADKLVKAAERITIVTSHGAKNSNVREDPALSTVKPGINFDSRPDDYRD